MALRATKKLDATPQKVPNRDSVPEISELHIDASQHVRFPTERILLIDAEKETGHDQTTAAQGSVRRFLSQHHIRKNLDESHALDFFRSIGGGARTTLATVVNDRPTM